MRINRGTFGISDKERKNRVRRRYWEYDQVFRKQPEGCSEDVWRQRKYRLTEGVFVDGYAPDAAEGEARGEERQTH